MWLAKWLQRLNNRTGSAGDAIIASNKEIRMLTQNHARLPYHKPPRNVVKFGRF